MERELLLSRGMLKKLLWLMLFVAAVSAQAGPANPILFVTQVPIPYDFATIASVFGNQLPDPGSCGRGGDLYVRYPDGTLKNLTRAAGYGLYGDQSTNGIAVREPSVDWDGKRAIFSMVVGTPTHQFDYTSVSYWQLYEITNFTDPNATPIITKVPNQPTNYNNVSPIYGTDGRILFTSDRPRNGQRNLYPQLDEYEEQPTVTGIWSLDPATGDLFLLNHTPSGAFSPSIDSGGRVIFVRWDHLQRDQQADTDWEETNAVYGAYNWSDESTNSWPTTNNAEEFPEPRSVRTDLLAGTHLVGHTFNQFFPWMINEDGTGEETINHVGRHELGGSYANRALDNDPNLQDLYYFGGNYNTNTIGNILQLREDPRVPGLFYGIDAPEFATHAAGQLVSLTGGTNLNADYMRITYLTPLSTRDQADPNNTPPGDTGFYRNPLMTTDGYMIAAHTSWKYDEDDSTNFPHSFYDFRLKFLQMSNGYYVPGTMLTGGLTNPATYWDPDSFVEQTNQLWELDPVEVVARPRPAKMTESIAPQELAAFATAGVDVAAFQSYLRTHDLALIISRDVTTRDKADQQQPFNLRVASSGHQTTITNKNVGMIYDIAWLQLFQADQLRSLNYGNTNNEARGRRVLAQYLHEPAVDNPSAPDTLLGSVRIAADGSQAAIVPAQRALTWQLADTNGVGVVRERYWLTFASGEIRTCTSCHGINEYSQSHTPAPTNMPIALVQLLQYWKTNNTTQPMLAKSHGTNYLQISFLHRPAEQGVTYHVQESANLTQWADIATYSGTNAVLSAKAMEISRIGSPNECVTLRDMPSATMPALYLRVDVTRP